MRRLWEIIKASNYRTTIVGVLEATLIAVPVQMLFDLSWQQRAATIGLALLRATFAAMSADSKKVKAVEKEQVARAESSEARIDARVEVKLEEARIDVGKN